MTKAKPSLLSLLLLTAFATILAVLFTPAFPEITKALKISPSMTQLTMTVFLIGYAIGNLPYGPLANRFGPKPTLLVGISIAFIGSVIVATIPSLPLLMGGRFLMGLGGSVGIKIATTMIGDVFSEQEARKITPYIVLSFAVVPAIAIFIGGILTERLGWESCLYFIVFYCIFQYLICLPLPETAKKLDPKALNYADIGEKYLQKTKNKTVMLCAFILGFGTSFVYLFASEAPFIGIQHLRLSPEHFGSLNFIPSIGMVAGSLVARYGAEKHSATTVLRWGTIITVLSAFVMMLLFWKGHISSYTLFFPMIFIYFGLSLIFSNALAIGISHAKDKGTASAVLNFFNILVSVLLLGALGAFPSHHLMTMPVLFVISGVILLFLQKQLPRKASR